jgi:hypothetical protein
MWRQTMFKRSAMDKKTYNLLMTLIFVAIVFGVLNVGTNTYFEIPGVFKAVGQAGPLILLGVIAILIYHSYKKKES